MKQILFSLLIISCLTSCTKEVNYLEPEIEEAQTLFFKDQNIAITNFGVRKVNMGAVVVFNTIYEQHITKIEVLSGVNEKQFAVIGTYPLTRISAELKTYETADFASRNASRYYKIRYTYKDGQAVETPFYYYSGN